jgi:hypothetical protein
LAEDPPLPPPTTDAREGEALAGHQHRPSAPAWSSDAAVRRNREENLLYWLHRGGRPTLSQSLRPAELPEEGERGAGGSTPPLGSVAGEGESYPEESLFSPPWKFQLVFWSV